MKITVLVNCFNYEQFVAEAIQSVFQQTCACDELIIVDDGSTDGSVSVIKNSIKNHPEAKLLQKKNGGQLSAFREGIVSATGELIFFLDADDTFEPEHIENALNCFERNPEVGFYFCSHKHSDDGHIYQYRHGVGILGPSALVNCYVNTYVGSLTSSIVMRCDVARTIMRLPEYLNDDWRVEADNCLIYGASFSGWFKFYNPVTSVNYRIHGGNNFQGVSRSKWKDYRYKLRLSRLFDAYKSLFGFNSASILNLHKEFELIRKPHKKMYKNYCKALRRASLPMRDASSIRFKLAVHYWGSLFR